MESLSKSIIADCSRRARCFYVRDFIILQSRKKFFENTGTVRTHCQSPSWQRGMGLGRAAAYRVPGILSSMLGKLEELAESVSWKWCPRMSGAGGGSKQGPGPTLLNGHLPC